MSAEVGPEVSVNTNSLMNMAAFWGESSSWVAEWATEISSSAWHRSPGIFGSVIGPYNQVCEMLGQLCNQGTGQMEAMSQALVKAAGNYESAEAQNTGLSNQIIGKLNIEVPGR
jgi:hypothetical protein